MRKGPRNGIVPLLAAFALAAPAAGCKALDGESLEKSATELARLTREMTQLTAQAQTESNKAHEALQTRVAIQEDLTFMMALLAQFSAQAERVLANPDSEEKRMKIPLRSLKEVAAAFPERADLAEDIEVDGNVAELTNAERIWAVECMEPPAFPGYDVTQGVECQMRFSNREEGAAPGTYIGYYGWDETMPAGANPNPYGRKDLNDGAMAASACDSAKEGASCVAVRWHRDAEGDLKDRVTVSTATLGKPNTGHTLTVPNGSLAIQVDSVRRAVQRTALSMWYRTREFRNERVQPRNREVPGAVQAQHESKTGGKKFKMKKKR